MHINRRSLLLAAATAAPALFTACGGARASTLSSLPFPAIADTSAASPDLVDFLNGFFAAKTRKDINGAMSFFSPQMVTYTDAVLGWDFAGWDALKAVLQQYMPNWPASAMSYPTRILGDMSGAIVVFTDTAELFGGEIHAMGAIDIQGGQIVRWVDYWDSRGWANGFGVTKTPLPSWHTSAIQERASPRIRAVASQFAAAASAGDAQSLAAMFTYDAIYEDMACRMQVLSRSAIGRYFARALSSLPNGTGSTLRHTLGFDTGGGFEWIGAPSSGVPGGVTALVLDGNGSITRATTMYDGGLFSSAQLQTLSAFALEP